MAVSGGAGPQMSIIPRCRAAGCDLVSWSDVISFDPSTSPVSETETPVSEAEAALAAASVELDPEVAALEAEALETVAAEVAPKAPEPAPAAKAAEADAEEPEPVGRPRSSTPTTPCACTCARSAACRCSPPRRRSSSPRGWSSAPRSRPSPRRRSSRSTSGRCTTASRRPAPRTAATSLPFEVETHRIVDEAIRSDDAMDLLITAPSFGFTDALKKAETDALKERLVRAQDLRSVYNERLDADTFLDLLNWIEGELGRPNAEIRASAGPARPAHLGPRRGRLPGDPPPPRGGPRRRDRRRDGRRSSRSWPSCRATT